MDKEIISIRRKEMIDIDLCDIEIEIDTLPECIKFYHNIDEVMVRLFLTTSQMNILKRKLRNEE